MKKSLLVICTAITLVAVLQSSITAPKHTSKTSGSGIATQTSCTGCHGAAVTGGTITLVGMPTSVIAGQAYTFSVHINDAKTSAANWGFAMTVASGVLSTTNTTYVGVTSGKLNAYHKTPPAVTDTAYSFTNVTWTAPATAGTVAFKFAGIAGNNNGSSGGDHSYKGTASITVALPTPVKMSSFDAALVANKVNLKWASASEVNTNNFVVERSIDGVNYVSAGTVKAVGNSLNLQVYSFSEDAIALSGTVYYRLKIVDNNGAASYSDVKSVSIKSTQSSVISVYPNPLSAGQDLKVKYLASKSDKVTFTLISAAGKRVVNTAASVNEGTNELSLSVGHLAAGTYYLSTNNSAKKQAVIVQ